MGLAEVLFEFDEGLFDIVVVLGEPLQHQILLVDELLGEVHLGGLQVAIDGVAVKHIRIPDLQRRVGHLHRLLLRGCKLIELDGRSDSIARDDRSI